MKNLKRYDHIEKKGKRGRLRRMLSGFLAAATAVTMITANAGLAMGTESSTEAALAGAGSGHDVTVHFGEDENRDIHFHVNPDNENPEGIQPENPIMEETDSEDDQVLLSDETESESEINSSSYSTGNDRTPFGEETETDFDTETEAETESEYPLWVTELTATLEDDVTIVVTCEEGVLPAGTTLKVSAVEGDDAEEAEKAVSEAVDAQGQTLNKIYTYDVTLLDAEGKEFEPSGEVSVHAQFHNRVSASEGDSHWNVYHIKDNGNVDDLNLNTDAQLDITTDRGNDMKEAQFHLDSFSFVSFVDSSGQEIATSGVATDFTDFITSVTVQKYVNGSWTAATSFDDGDTVRTQIDFSIPSGIVTTENNTIYYQMPDGLRPIETLQGTAYIGGNPVGVFQIDENGLITIIYNDSFATGEGFSGNIYFEGKVDYNGTGNGGEINFGGSGQSIEIKTSNKSYDLNIGKQGDYDPETNTVSYTVTASTTKGSDPDEPIKIRDRLQGSGSATGTYKQDTLKVYKVSIDGSKTLLTSGEDYTLEWTTDEKGPGFRVKYLASLAAGEKYLVTYDVQVDDTLTPKEDGRALLGNTAYASSGEITQYTGTDITIQENMIKKSGYYSQDKGMIHWYITINSAKVNLNGKTFEDILPVVDGEQTQVVGDVVFTSNSDSTKTYPATVTDGYKITCTFTEDDYDTYSADFYTTAPSVTEGTKTVTNTATFGGYSDDQSAWITPFDGQVTKLWKEEEEKDGGNAYKWSVIATIANKTIPASGYVFTDVIHDATIDGTAVEGSHYALLSVLEEKLKDHLKIVTDEGEIRYGEYKNTDPVTWDIEYYSDEAGTQPVDLTDENAHVKCFKITVTPTDGRDLSANKLSISSYRTVVVKECEKGETMVFTNEAIIPDHSSTASHEYSNPTDLKKSVQYSGAMPSQHNAGDKFSSGDISLDYNTFHYANQEGKKLLTYRIEVDRSSIGESGLKLIDTLPAGTSYVPNSCYIWVTGGRGCVYSATGACYVLGSWSSDFESIKDQTEVSFTKSQQNGQTVLTWEFPYWNEAETAKISDELSIGLMELYYTVSLDALFDDPTASIKQLTNSIEWDGRKTETQTTTITKEYKNVTKKGYGDSDSGTVSYNVYINPTAQDLDPNKETIQLEDTMTLSANGSTLSGAASLNVDSLRLVYYDPNAENYIGDDVPADLYKLQFDNEAQKIVATLPDGIAMVLIYTYNIDKNSTSADSITVNNSVYLNGVLEANDETPVKTSAAGSSASRKVARIYKIDSQTSKRISGAIFKLEKYVSGSWSTVNDNYVLSKDTTTAKWNNDWGPNASEDGRKLEIGILYRLTETEPPTGYAGSSDSYYFAFTDSNTSADQVALDSSAVQKDDVTFVGDNGANIFIKNTPTTITVKKVWLNADGSKITNPTQSVNVQLMEYSGDDIGLDAYKVHIIPYWSNGGPHNEIDVQVARGGSISFYNSSKWENATITLENADETTESGILRTIDNDCKLTSLTMNITQNCTIHVNGGNYGSVGVDGDLKIKYTEPSNIIKEGASGTVSGAVKTLNPSKGYSDTWPVESGCMYEAVEVDPPDDYTVSYLNNGITNGTITIVNRKKSGSLLIRKTSTGHSTPATAQFTITSPNSYSRTVYYNDFTQTGTDGEKTYTLTGLEPGDYTVQEVINSAQVNNYVLSVDGDQGVSKAVEAGRMTEASIVNTYSQKTSVKVTKAWKDGDGNELSEEEKADKSVTVHLYRASSQEESAAPVAVTEAERPEDYQITLSASNNWTYTWTNLPKTDSNGVEYIYYVKEEDAGDFSVSYSPSVSIGNETYGKAETPSGTSVQEVSITNYERVYYSMPATGGEGTRRLYMAGLALIALAGFGLVLRRRRENLS